MISTIATHPKPRTNSKRSSSSSRAMTPIPEYHDQKRHSVRQKPKVKTAKREDDIPLALLAYKKGYTTIHPTIPEKQQKQLTTGTNRSRESSTSRSILKQQQNTTDKQHRKSRNSDNNNNNKREKRNRPSSSTPSPPLQPSKPNDYLHPDKKTALTKHNELLFTKLKRWFSVHRISNKIKSS